MTFFSRYIIHKNSAKKRGSKTRKISLKSTTQRDVCTHEEQREIENPTHILDLPLEIVVDILSRLPLKRVSICRCVCRFWTTLIEKPDFTTMYLDRARPEIFIRNDSVACTARTLFLVDFDDVTSSVPLLNYERRDTTLNTKFHLPCRDREAVPTQCLTREFDIVNACNGFLCLRTNACKSPCLVVNPITGEFVDIPKLHPTLIFPIASGLGYSSRSNEYKVVCLVSRIVDIEVEVYTLGTDSWRKVALAPWDIMLDKSATFLNGTIHWLSADGGDHGGLDYALAFDFEDEKFRNVRLPTEFGKEQKHLGMGVLRGCLFVSEITLGTHFDIWVMNEYGVHESWNKEFSIDMFSEIPYRPLKFLEDGNLAIVCNRISLDSYNPVQKTCRKFEMRSSLSVVLEAITLVPSFASLRYAAHGDKLNLRHVESSSTEADGVLSLIEHGFQGNNAV